MNPAFVGVFLRFDFIAYSDIKYLRKENIKMELPLQNFIFVNSWKSEPHSKNEISQVVDNQNFLDVKDVSIIEYKKGYAVKLTGWSYDVETIDYPDNETFYNHQYFNFR